MLVTDTTLRDAVLSLLTTRMRTADMLAIAPYVARALPQLFSLECWCGATFGVAQRFVKEDPWAPEDWQPTFEFQKCPRRTARLRIPSKVGNVASLLATQAPALGQFLSTVTGGNREA